MSRRGGVHRGAALAVAGLAAIFVARAARADTWSELGDKGPNDPKIAERTTRSGLVVGLSVGVGPSGASGYPNDSNLIGNPDYYSASNLLVGNGEKLFVMGALADYANFGAWFGADRARSGDWTSSATGGGLRVELFPLFALVPSLKNLGVLGDFGIGGATLHAKSGLYPDAHGVQSFFGAGVFYEWTVFHALGGHAVLGPSLELDGVWSQAIASDTLLLGGRFAFYGGM